jgi:hypothetical protein
MCTSRTFLPNRVFPIPLFLLLWIFPGVEVFADDPPAGELPNVKKCCNGLQAEYKNKRNRDIDKILNTFNLLVDSYEKLSAKEQKLVVRTLRAAFDIKPPPENRNFLKAAAACLAEMGKEGLDALLYALKSKILNPKISTDTGVVEHCLNIREFVVEAIGITKLPEAQKPLFKLLWDDEARIIRSACRALSYFENAPLAQRKKIAEQLVKRYSFLHAQAESGAKRAKEAEKEKYTDRLITVEVSFNTALQRVTLRSFDSAPEWQNWFSENKDKAKW